MSGLAKFSNKKGAGGNSAGQGTKFYPRRYGGGASKAFTGKCEGLKGEIFDCGEVRHLEVYHKTREAILDYIQVTFKEGGDASRTIDQGVVVSRERPPIPADTTDIGEMEYWRYKMKRFVDSEDLLTSNLTAAYGLFWGQCTDQLKAKLEARAEFDEVRANADVIGLDQLMKAEICRTKDKSKSAAVSLYLSHKAWMDLSQGTGTEDEYFRNFNTYYDVIHQSEGGLRFKGLVLEVLGEIGKTVETASADELATAGEMAEERYKTVVFLYGANQAKHGGLIVHPANEFALGNRRYPETVSEAYSLLLNWTPPTVRGGQGQSHLTHTEGLTLATAHEGKYDAKYVIPGKERIVCHECGYFGHYKGNKICPKSGKNNEVAHVTGTDSTEVELGEGGEAKREEVHCTVGMCSLSMHDANSKVAESGFTFFTHATSGKGVKGLEDNVILLDNQSSCHLFKNRNLLTNVRKADHAIAIHSTAGVSWTDMVGDIPNFPDPVWLYEGGIANILLFSKVKEAGFGIEYCGETDSFNVHGPTKIIKFTKNQDGLYCHHVGTAGVTLVDIVADKAEGYTARQLEEAKFARKALNMTGLPSEQDFKKMVSQNFVHNCPVTAEAIRVAHDVFGPDVASLKGKMVRQKPERVVDSFVSVPNSILDRNQTVTLVADLMFVNRIPFLVTISRNITLLTVEYMSDMTLENLKRGMRGIVRYYHARGMRVQTAMVDGQFNPLRGEIGDVDLNVVVAGEHAPEIERAIRTIKERVRGQKSRLPYKRLPARLVIGLVSFSVFWINAFPHKNSVSQTISPRTIMTGRILDFRKHCRAEFGAYAQVYRDTTPHNSTDLERSASCIVMGPTGNVQGTYSFYHLGMGRVIKSNQFTVLPIPHEVIQRVEEIACYQNLPDDLIFSVTTGEITDGDTLDAATSSDPLPRPDMDHRSAMAGGPYMGVTNPHEPTPAPIGAAYTPPILHPHGPVVPDAVPDISNLDNPPRDDEGMVGNADEPMAGNADEPPVQRAYDTDVAHLDALIQELEAMHGGGLIDGVADGVTHGGELIDGTADGAENGNPQGEISTPPGRYNLRQNRTRNYVHRYGDDHVAGEAALLQKVTPPMKEIDMGLVMHRIMLTVGAKAVVQKERRQYSLKKGLKAFGDRGKTAVMTELNQIHMMDVFMPQDSSKMTAEEKRNALESLVFLEEKRSKKIKGRMCANGSKQREQKEKGEATSPTVMTDSVLITAAIDAAEGRDVAVIDLPGAFLHAEMDETVHMVMRGRLAELMVKVAPKIYRKYVTSGRNGEMTLYVVLQKALYGCLKSALLFYLKLVRELEKEGFTLNPYDPCVANKQVNGSQMTITFHVDDLKISHMDGAEVTKVIEWFKTLYGENVRVCRGPTYDYLGMILTFTNGKVEVSMTDYVKKTISEFPEVIEGGVGTPAGEHLFTVREEPVLLDEERAAAFHTTVAQLLFVTMRCRRDIQTAVAFLCTRVKQPDEDDWKKLKRVLKYLHGTVYLGLTLEANNLRLIQWWVDASFAVHKDFRSHTGSCMTLGKGVISTMSRKQRLNTKSSTEAEVVAVDDASSQILWTNYFIGEQGYIIDDTIVYQDNQSAILLENNGKYSSSKRTRHMNIRYFFITDRIKKGEMTIKYCPAGEMVADHFTKPLQGDLFRKFRSVIMNVSRDMSDAEMSWERDNKVALTNPQECVGDEGLYKMTENKLEVPDRDTSGSPVGVTFVMMGNGILHTIKVADLNLHRECA